MVKFIINSTFYTFVLLLSIFFLVHYQPETEAETGTHINAQNPIEAGRYLVTIGGCNDCHTAGYLQKEGNIPEEDWLTGSRMGFRGPWGTTYASNLRLVVNNYDEDVWVEMIKTRKSMPPMPWMNVNKMSEKDARAIYKYLKSLGPKGVEMPVALSPDREPETPYINFLPQNLEAAQKNN